MAYFYDYNLAAGWWFYFEIRYVMETPKFKNEFIELLYGLSLTEKGDDKFGKDDKKQKGISLH